MENGEPVTQDAEDIASGEYYRAARAWYSDMFHRPISERSYYVVVITLALINLFFAVKSFAEIFPIHQRVPFIVYSNDVWEDLPRSIPINPGKTRNENVAMMEFLLDSYVKARESYDLGHYELRYRSVWSQSSPEVFEHYKELMDASNVYGPYHLYTDRARRTVQILSVQYLPSTAGHVMHARITFSASVRTTENNQEESASKWAADIAYMYTPFVIDQSIDTYHWKIARAFCSLGHAFCLTGETPRTSDEKKPKVTAMTFLVSDYQVKELLE